MLKNMFTQHLDIDDGLSISGAGAEEPEVAEPAEGEEGAEQNGGGFSVGSNAQACGRSGS